MWRLESSWTLDSLSELTCDSFPSQSFVVDGNDGIKETLQPATWCPID